MDCLFRIPGYTFFRRDRHGRSHGGLLVYIKDNFQVQQRHDLERENIECITLDITLPARTHMLLFCCYRPPDFSPTDFFSTLADIYSSIADPSAILCLLGDLNARHNDWDSTTNPAGRALRTLLDEYVLTQCVTTATRFSSDGTSRSTLDLFATNRPDLLHRVETTDPISDHCCVIVDLSICGPSLAPRRLHLFPDYDNADWPGLRDYLISAPLFTAIQGTENVDAVWKAWNGIMCEAVQRYIPIKQVAVRPRNKIWMTSALHHLIRQKHRLFRAAKSTGSLSAWKTYTQARNRCNVAVQRARNSYLTSLHARLDNISCGSRTWWQAVKGLAHLLPPRSPLPDLLVDGRPATSDADKAEVLADFFAQQCTDQSRESTEPSAGAPYPLRKDHPSFEFPPLTTEDVLQALSRLPIHKSTGSADITNRVLRETAVCIAESLTYLYNLSIATLSFPTDWKEATVTPIFKQRGEPSAPTNYRPISLLPACGKLMDRLQSRSLCNYLVDNSLVSDHQFGFLPGRSTTLQLLHVYDKWLCALDAGRGVAAVFMDFHKAFDRVWHPGLLYKLGTCGLSPSATAWLRSYLTNRRLRVRVGSVLSSPREISAGVPQGSHLGPILFLVFINDLPSAVADTPADLYADDALLHDEITPASDLRPIANAVQEAFDWARSWHGQFSLSKTAALLLGPTANAAQTLPALTVDGRPIRVTAAHKHLGLTFSHDFRWRDHLRNVLRSGRKKAGLLRHLSRELSADITAKLYLTYVRPSLEYACPVWHCAITAEDTLALERIQASVARAILRSDWTTPKWHLFRDLDWPSLKWRRTVLSMKLFHSLLRHRHGPLASRLYPTSRVSLRKRRQLLLPRPRTTRRMKSFIFSMSCIWNALPERLQSIEKTSSFARALETHWADDKFNVNFCPRT